MDLPEDREIYTAHAEFCKVIAHPTRLMILSLLERRELSVGEIVESVGLSEANVSQHLRRLRDRHVVDRRKDGRSVIYRLSDPRLVAACDLMRSILIDGLERRGQLGRRVEPGFGEGLESAVRRTVGTEITD